MQKPPLTYQAAGLDLDLYGQTLAGMAPFLRRTHTPRVLDGFGGFASLFSLDYNSASSRNYRHPVLVSCTDGVGSKLKIAALANKHDTVGIDLVAMSVNDCLCTGGEPLIFLDYIAMPKDDPALTPRPHQRDQRRLHGSRLFAGGRRDGHPAGLLRGRRLRHGGLLRRRSGARQHH